MDTYVNVLKNAGYDVNDTDEDSMLTTTCSGKSYHEVSDRVKEFFHKGNYSSWEVASHFLWDDSVPSLPSYFLSIFQNTGIIAIYIPHDASEQIRVFSDTNTLFEKVKTVKAILENERARLLSSA